MDHVGKGQETAVVMAPPQVQALARSSPQGSAEGSRASQLPGSPGLEAHRDGPWGEVEESPAPYLVGTTHNSAQIEKGCPDSRWVRGVCEHGTRRWESVPCKRRGCVVCGPVGRWRIAERIAYGVRGQWPCAWLVLTFREDVEKSAAVRRVGGLVRKLRKRLPGLQYVATYELTRAGRLHVNLIAGPWRYVPHKVLRAWWGARVSVEWVRDDRAMGKEGAKAGSPGSLGGYLSKLEQAVPVDRRVSYSKGWPRLPKGQGLPRRGKIAWEPPDAGKELSFLLEKHGGHWEEVRPGEWRSFYGEECDCFELAQDTPPP